MLDGMRYVKGITLEVHLAWSEVKTPVTSLYEYSSPQGVIRHTLEARGFLADGKDYKLNVDINSQELTATQRHTIPSSGSQGQDCTD
jgi:hypothetical protein